MNDQIDTTEAEEKFPVKPVPFTRNLPCAISDKELIARARKSAGLRKEAKEQTEAMERALTHAKATAKEKESEIGLLIAEADRLLLEVNDGEEHRPVQCRRDFIYRTGRVVEIRLDTQAVLSERPMSEMERQVPLDLEGASGRGSDPDDDDTDDDEDDQDDEDFDIPDADVDEDPDTSVLNGGGDEDDDSGIVDDDYPAKSEPPLATQKKAAKKRAANGKGGKGARKGKG
jgi:hypothetical protein